MAREEKQFELRPVDDEVVTPTPVIRLGNDESSHTEKPIRLMPQKDLVSKRLDLPYELNLWEKAEDPQRPSSIVAPLDPADFQFDPLMLM